MKIDFKEYLKKRPLSYSSLSSFDYNREKWFETYILGKKQKSRQMDFGSDIDQKLQDDPNFLPQVVRCPLVQYKLETIFSGIPLVGKPDALNLDKPMLRDYKTGVKPWDKKRTDETKQLTMYLFLIYIQHKIKPEEFDCFIDWMPTQENHDFSISFVEPIEENIMTFKTKRTMTDILKFGQYIKKTVKEMEEYVKNHE